MKLLAAADALASLSGHRRQQVWDAAALHAPPRLLREAPVDEDTLELPEAPEGEEIVWDYAATGLTLRRHPLALLRPRLQAKRLLSSKDLQRVPDGREVRACGIVTLRQQPDTQRHHLCQPRRRARRRAGHRLAARARGAARGPAERAPAGGQGPLAARRPRVQPH